MKPINIYCDESCHLEHDQQKIMVLGAVWCPADKTHDIFRDIRKIKADHNLSSQFEIKWTKVSESKADFYLDLVKYFFHNKNLHFRALIVPDKSLLRHEDFEQDHDTWYYKMYFDMLKVIISPDDRFRIFVDFKDTHGGEKIRELHNVLSNNHYDFEKSIIQDIRIVRSHEVELIQITDLLIGTVAYANRKLSGNRGKEKLVQEIRNRTRYSLLKTTLFAEDKFNLFVWRAKECD